MSATGRDCLISPSTRFVAFVVACVCVVTAGCTRTPSAAERLKQAYESSGMTPVTVYPLAGTVTVDNAAPSIKSRKISIIMMAYDTSKPDRPVAENARVAVQSNGSFVFPDGGLQPGKYVMLFSQLHLQKKQGWHGPDELKNLYNDPDVNGKKTEFLVDHQAPGKTDYSFNLNVAGETAPTQPGPKALIELPN